MRIRASSINTGVPSPVLSDLIDPSIKYGGGGKVTKEFLQTASNTIAMQEDGDRKLMKVLQLAASEENISDELKQQIAFVQEQQEKSRLLITEHYRRLLKALEN